MAGLNSVFLQGRIPTWDNSIRTFYLDDDKKASVITTISVKNNQKNDQGYNLQDNFTIKLFGKTAQNFAKFVTPGSNVVVTRGSLVPGGKKYTDGQGNEKISEVYVNVQSWEFQEGNPKKQQDQNTTAATQSVAAGAPAAPAFDGMNFGMPATGAAPAAGINFAGADPFAGLGAAFPGIAGL